MICAPPYIYYRLYTNDKKRQSIKGKANGIYRYSWKKSKGFTKFIKWFFELSIIELPDYCMELEKININNILCEVIASFYSSFVDKNITPKIDLPKENIMVIGNEGAIKRILQNLIVNMIKHSKEDVYISLKKKMIKLY